MPRLPLLALALAVLAAASASLARADGAAPPSATVTIAPSGDGAATTLDLATLADRFDVHGVTYTLRAADGTTSTTTVAAGISLTALLAAAGLDADAFDYIDLTKADGSSAILMRDDLGGTGEGPPVVWSDDQGVHFLRPSGGDGDANGADLVTIGDGPIAVALKRGQPLVPRIAVSLLRVRPHQRVDFSASLVGGASLGPGLDYQWYFDGTGNARGANVSHRFPPSDRPYLVLLNVVRGDGTSVGAPDSVNIRVVRVREPRSGGAHRSDESQGDGGSGGDGSGSGGSGGSGAGGSGTSGTDVTAPAYVAPPPPAAAPPPTTPTPARRDRPAPPRRPRGDLVSGTLIASASAAATPAGGSQAARAAARGAASDGPLHVPIGLWVGAGLALLLALGWALESRHTLPFWQP